VNEILEQINEEKRVFLIDPKDKTEIDKVFRSLKEMRGIDSPKNVF
jgi:hypothetical protein